LHSFIAYLVEPMIKEQQLLFVLIMSFISYVEISNDRRRGRNGHEAQSPREKRERKRGGEKSFQMPGKNRPFASPKIVTGVFPMSGLHANIFQGLPPSLKMRLAQMTFFAQRHSSAM